jgi:hypothetical protein
MSTSYEIGNGSFLNWDEWNGHNNSLLAGENPDPLARKGFAPSFRQRRRKTEVVNMDQDFSVGGIVVPAVALRREQRRNKYGTLADLPDEELADPDELERVVYKEMWWPILRLPQQRWESSIRPNIEDGRVDWGAFGTVDFDSYRPQSNRLLCKAEQMKEQLKDRVNLLRMIADRIPGTEKYKVLSRVRRGLLDPEAIKDMWQLAVGYVRAWRLQEQIEQLLAKSRKQQEQRLKAWLES